MHIKHPFLQNKYKLKFHIDYSNKYDEKVSINDLKPISDSNSVFSNTQGFKIKK